MTIWSSACSFLHDEQIGHDGTHLTDDGLLLPSRIGTITYECPASSFPSPLPLPLPTTRKLPFDLFCFFATYWQPWKTHRPALTSALRWNFP